MDNINDDDEEELQQEAELNAQDDANDNIDEQEPSSLDNNSPPIANMAPKDSGAKGLAPNDHAKEVEDYLSRVFSNKENHAEELQKIQDYGEHASQMNLLAGLNSAANRFGSIGGKSTATDNSTINNMAAQDKGQQSNLLGQISAEKQRSAKERTDAMKAYLANQRGAAHDAANLQRSASHDASAMDRAKLLAGSRVEAAKAGGTGKEDKATDKAFIDLADKINPSNRKSGLQKFRDRIASADRVDEAIKQSGGNPNKIMMRELATAVAGMLSSGSQSAVAQINELVPHTSSGETANIEEWLTNEPRGAGQQAFVKQLQDIVSREKYVTAKQIRDTQKSVLDANIHLKAKNPDRWNATVNAFGVDKDIPEPVATYSSAPEQENGGRGAGIFNALANRFSGPVKNDEGTAIASTNKKQIVRKQQNPDFPGKVKVFYKDGTDEVIDAKQ